MTDNILTPLKDTIEEMRAKHPELAAAYERGKASAQAVQEYSTTHPYPTSDPEAAAQWNRTVNGLLGRELGAEQFLCLTCRDTGWLKQGDATLLPCNCGGWNPIKALLKFSGIRVRGLARHLIHSTWRRRRP